ncbi:MAG: hypothetical protein DRJ05_09350 [Bacteroidetes bacterium]|nr:MAG: hypothetical protein DRJ05_09350 [Bacteroidota bacterium]
MKAKIFTILLSIIIISSVAQNNIGINNPSPDPSAALDVTSTNTGFLPPRIADTTAISNPAEGLVIYDLSSHCMRYFNGTLWSDCIGGFSPVTPFTCGGLLHDNRDGQSYSTVQIGSQCWMAENLNIGIKINIGSTPSNNGTIEKYCYDNNNARCNVYGGLYFWNEMMQYETNEGTQGICPDGWHIPTDDEFCTLYNEVDIGTISCTGPPNYLGTDAGGNLKETGTSHWNSPNTGATNSSGFTALPSGAFVTDPNSNYLELGFSATFWASSTYSNFGLACYLNATSAQVVRSGMPKSNGVSVRCIKD